MPIEATPLASVTTTKVVTCRDSGPDAHRRMIRNCGTAPAVNATVLAAAAGTVPCSENASRTICVIVVATADAAVYRVKVSRTRR